MNKKGSATIGTLIVQIIVLAVVLVPLSYWTGRNLDFWITHFKGHAVHVPFWLDLLATIVGNGFILIANVVGEIARFFL